MCSPIANAVLLCFGQLDPFQLLTSCSSRGLSGGPRAPLPASCYATSETSSSSSGNVNMVPRSSWKKTPKKTAVEEKKKEQGFEHEVLAQPALGCVQLCAPLRRLRGGPGSAELTARRSQAICETSGCNTFFSFLAAFCGFFCRCHVWVHPRELKRSRHAKWTTADLERIHVAGQVAGAGRTYLTPVR